MKGWISISRSGQDHPIFHKRHDRWYLWTWMVAQAAWTDTHQFYFGKKIPIKRGQFMTSYRQISEATGCGLQVVRTLLKLTQDQHRTNTEANTGYMIVAICNFDVYQGGSETANTGENEELNETNTLKKKKKLKKKDSCQLAEAIRRDLKTKVSQAYDEYKKAAEKCGWPVPQALTEKRSKAIGARIKESGIDGWNRMLTIAASGEWMGTRDGPATIDWLANASNFQKVIEGNYQHDRSASRFHIKGGKPAPTPEGEAAAQRVIEWLGIKNGLRVGQKPNRQQEVEFSNELAEMRESDGIPK